MKWIRFLEVLPTSDLRLLSTHTTRGMQTSTPLQDDDEITVIQEDDTDAEDSQRGKKKHKPSTNSNELLEFLKQKWEEDKEAEAIIHAENLAVREKHLDLMERNTEASCSIAESFKIMAERRN